MHTALMHVLTALLALLAVGCSAQRPAVTHLTRADFEHKTQAATGQTTGIWYILFTSNEEPSLRWLDDVWHDAANGEGGEEGPRIHFASVDTATDPALGERFAATAPAVLLFRQRKVFRYKDSDMSAEALRRFARAPASPGEPVPPPPGALELALRALRGNELAVLVLKAAFAVLAIASAVSVTRRRSRAPRAAEVAAAAAAHARAGAAAPADALPAKQ